uniref:Flavodoxin-like domain-containing protein n=1 Tax=Gracilinema caldarium TaxID=215591 RepID=A0A7C3EFW7_9SPIR
MRIALVYAQKKKGPVSDAIKALSKGMESMGHRIDLLDAWTDDGIRLPGYEYIVIAAESTTLFGGRMPEALTKIFSNASSLVGKKSAAFLLKTTPWTTKAMTNLMRVMEKEGMFVNWSDIIVNSEQAEALGKRIGA